MLRAAAAEAEVDHLLEGGGNGQRGAGGHQQRDAGQAKRFLYGTRKGSRPRRVARLPFSVRGWCGAAADIVLAVVLLVIVWLRLRCNADVDVWCCVILFLQFHRLT
jgi:hypothetical protein